MEKEMIESIEIAKIIHPTVEGRESIVWDWLEEEQASFAVIGDKENSARVKVVNDIAQLIHDHDPEAVYWITSDNSGVTGNVFTDHSITILENYGDIDKQYDPHQIFRGRRNRFSSMYFDMFAQGYLDKPLNQVVMPISYRAHLEGPLHGYERIIAELKDYQSEMTAALDIVKEVKWYESNVGRKFLIDSNQNPYQQAMSLVLAVWDLWSMFCLKEDPQQYLIIVELPKSMVLSDSHDTPVKKTIISCIEYLKSFSQEATLSFIVSSETVFPMPETGIRQQIYLPMNESDFDIFEEASRALFGPEIYELWDQGHKEAGVLVDGFTREMTLISLQISRYKQPITEMNHDDVIPISESVDDL